MAKKKSSLERARSALKKVESVHMPSTIAKKLKLGKKKTLKDRGRL